MSEDKYIEALITSATRAIAECPNGFILVPYEFNQTVPCDLLFKGGNATLTIHERGFQIVPMPPPRHFLIRCDMCRGGIVPNGNAWPERCRFCTGRGSMSLEHICLAIRENVSTVRKLLRPNRPMRAKVAYRILINLDKWLHPRQPEMFR